MPANLPADLILICAGVVPNVELAREAGLDVCNGIAVDSLLLSRRDVSAIGDCAWYPSTFANNMIRTESVQNAIDQARCVASRLVGKPEIYNSVPWFWSDQGDAKLQIAGIGIPHDQVIVRGSADENRFSVFCFRSGKLVGVESVNSASDHMAARQLFTNDAFRLTPQQVADEHFNMRQYTLKEKNSSRMKTVVF